MRPNEQELAELHEGEIVVYERKNKLLELLAKGRRETEYEGLDSDKRRRQPIRTVSTNQESVC